MPHDIKSLPPWGTAAGEHFWRQGRAARCQDPAAQRHGGRLLTPCHVALGPFSFFHFFIFKTLLTFLKTTN
jgi:hypothetical protein